VVPSVGIMVRMVRRVFTLLSALSMVLCVAVAILWVRGRSRTYRTGWVNAGGTLNWWIECSGGEAMTCCDLYPSRQFHPGQAGWIFENEDGTRNYQIFLIVVKPTIQVGRFAAGRDKTTGHDRMLVIAPSWVLVLGTSFLPAAYILRYRHNRNKQAGCCTTCGYDLRASPDRCPECGTVRTA
jgi:hypothetical protein